MSATSHPAVSFPPSTRASRASLPPDEEVQWFARGGRRPFTPPPDDAPFTARRGPSSALRVRAWASED